jgi:N-acetylglucosaminyl-diphospho-decaprenol L-rhamnosyltransferase
VIDVLVVTHNSGSVINECVEGFVNPCIASLVVVDAGSVDPSYLDRLPEPAVVVRTYNHGYGTCMNMAAQRGAAPWLAMVNPDAYISAPELASLMAQAERVEADAIGPLLVDASGQRNRQARRAPCPPWRRFRRPTLAFDNDAEEVEILQGAIMLIRRSAFEAVGGFDVRYFLYGEEDDLLARMRSAGSRVYLSHSIVATHVGAGSSTGVSLSWRTGQQLRGRTQYIARHHSLPEAAIAYIVELVRVCRSHNVAIALAAAKVSARDPRKMPLPR